MVNEKGSTRAHYQLLQERLNEIGDIYGEQKILKDGIIPKELVPSSQTYLKQCIGLKPPKDIWCHITGSDIIRGGDGHLQFGLL